MFMGTYISSLGEGLVNGGMFEQSWSQTGHNSI